MKMRALVLLFLTFIHTYKLGVALNSTCLYPGEYNTLELFFNSLGGANWVWLSPTSEYGGAWNFSGALQCPCSPLWQGLKCILTEDLYWIDSIILNKYNLQGEVISSIDRLTHLQYLELQNNNISGTIPASIGNMSNMVELALFNNIFHGCIPTTITKLAKLQSLNLKGNHLSGVIPPEIGLLGSLTELYLQNNHLTGTIPESVCNLTKLENFQIGTNSLHGSISHNIGNMRQLLSFVVNTNKLTGTLPLSLCNLSLLQSLTVYGNDLTGRIPQCIGVLTSLTGISMMQTYVTGPLPDSIGNLTRLTTLNLRVSLLSGSLPVTIGGLKSVKLFEIQANCFTGTVPLTLSTMTSLTQFYMYSNFLEGPVAHIFDPVHQRQLTQVEMNNNAFTGMLPYNILGIPSLSVFVASVNCLHGSIPESVCNSRMLNIFALDGASSAPACQRSIFPGELGIHTYALGDNQITGTIPECMYRMPNLRVLHLSGNNIQSRLSNNISVSPLLTTLVLAHNQITGYVPLSMQRRSWQILDLSYNKLSGTLTSDFHVQDTNASVGLDINRLSGDVPVALQHMRNVTILNGNIFSCGYRSQGLPDADSSYEQYQCGSNSVNVMLIVWIALLVAVVGIMFLIQRCAIVVRVMSDFAHCVQVVTEALAVYSKLSASSLQDLARGFNFIRRRTMMFTCFIAIVLLPVYGALRVFYSTYSYLYADTISAVFLSGRVPAYVLLTLWFTMTVVILLYFEFVGKGYARARPAAATKSVLVESADGGAQHNITAYRVYIVFVVFANVIMVSTVNACFVLVSITSSTSAVAAAQLALAIFKIGWSGVVMQYLTSSNVYVPCVGRNNMSPLNGESHYLYYWPRSVMLVINNTLIPIIATAVVDPSCFYNAFAQASNIVINIDSDNCTDYDCSSGECICNSTQQNTIITTYSPPFNYSYQCSSSLVRTYAPVFAMLVLFDTFAIPARSLVVILLQRYGILDSAAGTNTAERGHVRMLWNRIKASICYDDLTRPYEPKNMHLNVDSAMMALINLLLILLTWGVAFPPLALVACVGVYVRSYHIQAGVGRRIQSASRDPTVYCSLVSGCATYLPYFLQSVKPVLAVSCLFYGLILFDTLGDVTGGTHAVWIFVTMLCGPFCVYNCVVLVVWVTQWCVQDGGGDKVEDTIEDATAEIKNALHVEL